MVRILSIAVAVLFALALAPQTALAHRDYEEEVGTTLGPDGSTIRIVLHYKDGIMATDPVKLVLYDASNAIVAETPYYRDVLVHTDAAGETYAFALDGLTFFFRSAWQVDGNRLVPIESPRCYYYAALAAGREHWLGYPIALGFLIPGIWMWRFRKQPGCLSRLGEGLFCVGLGFVVLALIYDRLSVPLIALLTMILTLPCWWRRLRAALGRKAES